jgi:cation diffusion facilitator CzcD-associated flavoprotein CzcO
MDLAHSIRRVAVIGAGPSGLAAVKYAHMLDSRFA